MNKNKYIKMQNDNEKFNIKSFIIGLVYLVIIVALIILLMLKILLPFVFIPFFDMIYNVILKVSHLDAVIIVALITGTLSLIGVIINSIVSKLIDYTKSRNDYLAKKRESVYKDFISMIYDVFESAKKAETNSQEELIKNIFSFNKQLTLWGSKKVVKGWLKYKSESEKHFDNIKSLLLLENIVNDMRKDIGTEKLGKYDILSFFIKTDEINKLK